ncbi:hypothetical protein GOP47_0006398 [Adiantum capillus-veneris]|uniref:Uncharacterized protein n=1 Tax=Adiantum capillus-veneris TaxID=13818 RepID=A0A9D4ZM01_ADICA|nr:hypothetical protein GOP47_0006398 [Adiantum capillus-veneris]
MGTPKIRAMKKILAATVYHSSFVNKGLGTFIASGSHTFHAENIHGCAEAVGGGWIDGFDAGDRHLTGERSLRDLSL